MFETWLNAYTQYDWTVDLSKFKNRKNYPGFFNNIITPQNLLDFEKKFHKSIEDVNHFEVAGEVCFWKNFGTFQSRNRLTIRLLDHLKLNDHWEKFKKCIRDLSETPSYVIFDNLRKAANQPKGFASPITFLSFYNPSSFPMIDKNIAYWWSENKARFGYEESVNFSQRSDGWIQTYTRSQNIQNWNAYLEWTKFCCDYSKRIINLSKFNNRARDVEMAIWEAQKRGIKLTILPV